MNTLWLSLQICRLAGAVRDRGSSAAGFTVDLRGFSVFGSLTGRSIDSAGNTTFGI